MLVFDQKTPSDVLELIAKRVAARRKELGYTQVDVAKGAGMSLGSLRRFEQKHEISFSSLVRIAFFLRMDSDFDDLFSRKAYRSIDEVVAEYEKARSRR